MLSHDILLKSLEMIDQGVWVIDSSHTIVYANRKMLSITGYKASDFISKNVYQDFPHNVFAEFVKYYENALKSEEEYSYHFNYKNPKGVFQTLEGVLLPYYLNYTQYTFITSSDISHKEEFEKNFFLLYNKTNSGMALHKVIYDYNKNPIDYIYIDVNPAFENLTGLKKHDLIGKTILEVMPNTEQYWIDLFGNVAKNMETAHYQNYAKELGKYYDVVAFSPKKDYFSVVFHDVTEKVLIEKKLKETQSILEAVFENIPFDIWVRDKNQVAIFQNKKCIETFGNLIDKTPYNADVDEETKLGWIDNNNKALEGNIVTEEQTYKGLNGNNITALKIIAPFKYKSDDEVDAIVGINIDITDRKKMEMELIKAKIKAEESDKLKSAFLANISHEIRTPMNSIMGFSNLLMDADISKEERHEFATHIQKSSKRLLGVISDLVELSSIQSGVVNLNKEEFSISQVINEIIDTRRLGIVTKELYIRFDQKNDKDYIYTDKSKFARVINHLLSNAIKFTYVGGIKIDYAKTKRNYQFIISDTGIGIADSDVESIFDKFRQLEEYATRSQEGAGLGLSIVKALVELLGGKVSVKSCLNEGSSFTFTIPIEPVKKSIAESYEETVSNLRILIVDDEPSNMILLKKLLNKNTIYEAYNGLQAIETVRSGREIDIVLMDLKMPIIDGFEAGSFIKNYNPEIPIIAQTAYSNEKEKLLTKEIGFCDYLIKPIRKHLLYSTILKHVKQKK